VFSCVLTSAALENLIYLIRFIVVEVLAGGDLALLEFVYRSDSSPKEPEQRGEG